MTWQPYLISLCVGLSVGVIYGLITVRSPAPPTIALLGLLGMLAGESLVQWIRGHQSALSHALHEKSFAVLREDLTSTDQAKDRSDG